jgi:hypothetical protein
MAFARPKSATKCRIATSMIATGSSKSHIRNRRVDVRNVRDLVVLAGHDVGVRIGFPATATSTYQRRPAVILAPAAREFAPSALCPSR